jgi:2-amino-4-hydroxy-6-hydroxymethyldihydropteridine diphosphokinase
MGLALLSLGSNLEPERYLRAAAADLRARFPGVRFSPVLRTPAEGFEGPDFLNAGAVLESELDPVALDAWLHALEDAHGRVRGGPRFSSRTLDIDLVYFGDVVMAGPGNLQLPRPELRHAFVLQPLAALCPDFVDPVQRRTLADLWAAHPQSAAPIPAEPWAL